MRRFSAILLFVLLVLPFTGAGQVVYDSRLDSTEIYLRESVKYLTDAARGGRGAGTAHEKEVAEYLYDKLSKAGVIMLSPRRGDDFYIAQKDTIHSQNVIGVVEGCDPNLKNEYVVLGAHYDHLGTININIDGVSHPQIYYGADDNASGVATLLEIAKQVVQQNYMFRRSVIFAFFGAEELGMAGSWYFLNRSFPQPDDIVAMINLDMVGRSGGENQMQVFTADANADITEIINTLSNRSLSISPKHSPTDYFPSDHRVFYERGIPVALFTSGVHRDYHTVRDTPDKLDYHQMERLAEYVFAMTEVIANKDERIQSAVAKVNKEKSKGGETIYTQSTVDKRATFLHGEESQFLNRWVYEYIKYPDSAIREGVKGRVVAEFVVGKDGRVRDVAIVRGVSEELDAQVVKVITASPKWKPAQIGGSPVSVRITVPVEFKLTKSSTFKLKK